MRGYDGKLIRIGTFYSYKKVGTYEYMLEQHGLMVLNLVDTIKTNI